jgi:hypothetical protein
MFFAIVEEDAADTVSALLCLVAGREVRGRVTRAVSAGVAFLAGMVVQVQYKASK